MHPGICQESLSSRQTKVRKLATTGNLNHMANAYGLVALCALFSICIFFPLWTLDRMTGGFILFFRNKSETDSYWEIEP